MFVLSRHVCVQLAFFLAGARSAYAEEGARQAIVLQGRAQPVCHFEAARAVRSTNMAVGGGSASQNILSVTQLIDSNARAVATSIAVTLKGMCNHPHVMTVSSGNGGLDPQTRTEAGSGFVQRFNYGASVAWGPSVVTLQTGGIQGQSTPEAVAPGAVSGDLRIDIEVDDPGDSPVVAGTYTDNLVITFRPLL
ncbi:hypothetical protein Rvan_3181 [Rhodomicrobium vannielii ATCC 17100]|uniref:Spore coat protein U domain-containing protein n=2 Tax=Rhodomicrobium vannielii TaxID=1069 RepID=E3I1K2_RHOVT|nr:hypothetical protein Rvan_3181 [Rhodomicrobium vannielii ATCC 17100]